ncbi:MAG: hypothetical protein QXR30_00430 [Candidatus Woesearchaeota archaeon]
MGIGDIFQSVADFIERLKSEFSPEFENKGKGIILILFFFAVFIHLLDLTTNFNRGYLINTFLFFYIIYGFFFYFFTLPSDTFFKWDNLIFCFLLSLFSFFLPIPFIYLSKFFPWIIVFLVFTPIWPIFILYSFYNDVPIFKFLLNGYVLFWTIFFLIYFMANLPTIDGVSPVYKNTINIRKTIYEYVFVELKENVIYLWTQIKTEAVKLFNMFRSGEFTIFKLFLGKSLDEFIDENVQKALGLDTEIQNVENITIPPSYGLTITNIESLLNKYPKNSKIKIYFQVENKGVNKKLSFYAGCKMQSEETVSSEMPEISKLPEKGDKNYILGKVNSQFLEKKETGSYSDYDPLSLDFSTKYELDKDESLDLECTFENIDTPGKKNIEIYVIYFSNVTSTLQYYLINQEEVLKLRKKKQNFFEAYNLKLPATIYDPFEPYLIRMNFYAQPLINETENLLQMILEKNWNLDGDLYRIYKMNLSFGKTFTLSYYEVKNYENKEILIDISNINCDEINIKSKKAVCNIAKEPFKVLLKTNIKKPIDSSIVSSKIELMHLIKKTITIEVEDE